MKNIINQLINENLTLLQLKFFLFLISNYEFLKANNLEITITQLSEKLSVNEKTLLKELKNIVLEKNIIKYKLKDKEIEVIVNEVCFKIINDTRSKLKTKSVDRKKDIISVFSYWQEKCDKKRAKLDLKREKIINNALENYSIEEVYKAIDGCSKTLWNMGYDKYGNKIQTVYNELSLIFRNIEYVERFINNSQLPSIEEQIKSLQQIKKVPNNSRELIDNSRTDWKENRLGIFDN